MEETIELLIKKVAKKYEDSWMSLKDFDYAQMFKVTTLDYLIEHTHKKEMLSKMEELNEYYTSNPDKIQELVEKYPIK